MKRIIKGWEHRSWGDNINWINWEARRLYGLAPFRPQVGDQYQDKMRSGKIALFEIVDVKRPGNPRDMFFATVKDVGYLDEAQP